MYPKFLANSVPTITVKNEVIKIKVGDTFEPKEYILKGDVTAYDKEDKDLTGKINVIKNTVNTRKAGTYEVTYKVTDSKGASATKTIKVVVNPKFLANSKPEIIVNDVITIKVGDKFNPKKYVKAYDKEDGDITRKIKVIKNNVNTRKAGTYKVTYKVTDSKRATTTKTIKVVVKPKFLANSKPVIIVNDVIKIKVWDEFEPKDHVKVLDKEDGNITHKVQVITDPVDTSKPGIYKVTYKVTDSKGATTTKTIKVIVENLVHIPVPLTLK